jgi:pimeloyl-ACP methyl ester carboxylesterase
MYEMSIDIENTLEYLNKNNLVTDLSVINLIGHSTGGGSAYLYCDRNECETLVLQDPFFVPVVAEYGGIILSSPTYFIYSEDWYRGNEDINEMLEIDVYKNYLAEPCISNTCAKYAKGFYLADSAHYDFVAFGAISSLTKYTFLKGSIDYTDSIKANNRFNLEALNQSEITTDNLIIQIEK